MEIGFVNFNQEALGRAGKVLKMLQGQGAIDELGLGRIRDVFSNSMFPGLSVLQTRAKYFLILPALYAHLEKKRIADAREARAIVRDYEVRITRRLMDGSEENAGGIIGADSLRNREKYVKYDPTYVYQAGMETYGLLKTSCNFYAMLAERSAIRDKQPKKMRGSEAEDSDDLAGLQQLFMTCGEDYRFETSERLDIELSSIEAGFLKNRIENAVRGSLISELLDTGLFSTITNYDFELLGEAIRDKVSDGNFRIYTLSLRYSQFAYLLRLFYAMLYDRGVGASTDAEEKAVHFKEYLELHQSDFMPEKIEEILSFAAPKLTEDSSIHFCRRAARLIADGGYSDLEKLIASREQAIKGPRRSKLMNPHDYEPGKPFEIPALMTYRWSTIVRNVFNDISKGLAL
ncbi:MAG: DUF6361 family protein [Muribaculum sp.]|nr:DUF6361 family protein [Muribaculum sp.]